MPGRGGGVLDGIEREVPGVAVGVFGNEPIGGKRLLFSGFWEDTGKSTGSKEGGEFGKEGPAE